MQLSILVEPVAGYGYRARAPEPFPFSAEGSTREEAVARVRQLCQERLTAGAEVVTVEIGPAPHPWARFAGMFKDDADFQDVLQIMAENRRKMDEDPDVL